MDLYGDRLAEAQVAESTAQSSRGRRTLFRNLRIVLSQGDVYSTCGVPQRYALVGQLGMASRLDRHTLGYEFVYPILPGASPVSDGDANANPGLSLRGSAVPQDAFVVLWCGGYNVWTDVDTLFRALEEAMTRDPRIAFVSVGGNVDLGGNTTYDRLLAKIEASVHRQRYHMLGWRPAHEIPGYYKSADIGVSLSAFHYETLLGTRTRLVEMMGYGLPVVASLGCELTEIIRDRDLGLVFPMGDAAAFRDQILTLSGDPDRCRAYSQRALRYTENQLSFVETTRVMREWAQKPRFAPDRGSGRRQFELSEIEYYLRSVVRGILWRLFALEPGE
jgi:glycosyltransferase involved in cell wall biosynthesis